MIIAIDGPAAAGKGTLARRIAAELDYAYLDTGILYRAAGMAVVRAGGDPADPVAGEAAALNLDPATFNDPALRSDEGANAASKISAIPVVRAALLTFQRRFSTTPPDGKEGVVMDGRDIGTVVCPDADVKLFVTASTEVRAQRRFKELQERGVEAIYARVLQDMQERDERDSSRDVAPMKAADDAHLLDTSAMDAETVFDKAMAIIAARKGA
ncbi:MAG: (d)CMP kinase [Rhodospirillales bacterium]|nr:(d)CMP kinase [Rhodospirillales bacterium]MCW8862332.1 (d)CMP kinase [Rhodospirillales bacterium]